MAVALLRRRPGATWTRWSPPACPSSTSRTRPGTGGGACSVGKEAE